MRLGARTSVLLLSLPLLSFGQSKEYLAIQDVNRNLLLLEDKIKEYQKATDEKLEKLLQQVQQAVEAANKAGASASAVEGELRKQQQNAAATSAKVDQIASDFQALQEAVKAGNVRLASLEGRISDVKTALTTMPAPPAPPGGTTSGLSADGLYESAVRDMNAGNLQMALNGFASYLVNYGASLPLKAAVAQYYIGQIYFDAGEWQKALDAYDQVLEKFPENERTPDAHYMKFRTLLAMKKLAEALDEYDELARLFPNHSLTIKAKSELPRTAARKPPATKPKKK